MIFTRKYQCLFLLLLFLLGTKELVVSVNDDGIISLNFECDQMAPNSEFTWSKDYVATEDSERLEVESKGNKYGLFQL